MSMQHARQFSRRKFLSGVMLAGTVGLHGLTPRQAVAEAPPETSTLRIGQSPAICFAPQYVAAEQLFQTEGFGDVQYIKRPLAFDTIVSGEADFTSTDVGSMIVSIDEGAAHCHLRGAACGGDVSQMLMYYTPNRLLIQCSPTRSSVI